MATPPPCFFVPTAVASRWQRSENTAAAQRKLSRSADISQNIIDIFRNSTDIFTNSIEIFENISDILSLEGRITGIDASSGWVWRAEGRGLRGGRQRMDSHIMQRKWAFSEGSV
jgi:hypothetical protein